MTKTKHRQYAVQAVIKNVVSVEVSASSLDDAVAKSKELGEDAFIEILGENIDGNYRISGVYEMEIDT